MTPAQCRRKAAQALDAYEQAYNDAVALLKALGDPDDDRAVLDAAHRVFRDLRRRAEGETA
jgi:superfamily I DNA/RNA helicase